VRQHQELDQLVTAQRKRKELDFICVHSSVAGNIQ